MLTKRVIVCLDVRNRMVTKGVKFEGNVDLGDPVEMGRQYYLEGADELVFYDIMASAEGRPIDIGMVREVAKKVFIPFSVGGGIRDLADMREVLLAGAEKVSVNSLAVRNPEIIAQGAKAFGRQCIVLGMDAKRSQHPACPSGYEVVVQGGRKATGMDALAWAKKAEELGAGEICLNSIDADGTRTGYEINLTRMVADAVGIPVIASGGAGEVAHLETVLREGHADAALIASMVHYGTHTLGEIKRGLAAAGLPIRPA